MTLSLPKPLEVKCPTCGQVAGEPCINNQGREVQKEHTARVRAWLKKQEFVKEVG